MDCKVRTNCCSTPSTRACGTSELLQLKQYSIFRCSTVFAALLHCRNPFCPPKNCHSVSNSSIMRLLILFSRCKHVSNCRFQSWCLITVIIETLCNIFVGLIKMLQQSQNLSLSDQGSCFLKGHCRFLMMFLVKGHLLTAVLFLAMNYIKLQLEKLETLLHQLLWRICHILKHK